MTDHFYSDQNDSIDVTGSDYDWSDNIFAGLGDDHILLGDGVIYVSEAGNDTIIGSDGTGQYAAWLAPSTIEVNLREGWANDGFGGRDSLQGISAVHMPEGGGSVIGGEHDEQVIAFSGLSSFRLGGGTDTVTFYDQNSGAYSIVFHGDETIVYNDQSVAVLHNVENLSFDDAVINISYERANLRADRSLVHSFTETEVSNGWWYAEAYNAPQIVGYSPGESGALDINNDGYLDAILPLDRGYRTGVDTRMDFQVFLGGPGGLEYSPQLTSQMPFVAGARRVDTIEIARTGQTAFVTIAHDTAIETETRYDLPWRLGDLTLVLPAPSLDVAQEIIPEGGLLYTDLTGRTTAVDAHAMAVGDYDGDGLEDILIGDFQEPFVLRQTLTGSWEIIKDDFLRGLDGGWFAPVNGNAANGYLLDLHMADLDGDGFDDIVAGWGHERTASRIYFNDGSGGFSETEVRTLPQSIYGDNSLHLRTFSEDFDGDGDLDLAILRSRDLPFYGGTYLQYLENDGSGQFSDTSEVRLGDAFPEAVRYREFLGWTDRWEVADLNNDGSMDFIGGDLESNDHVIMLINDGEGNFTRHNLVIAHSSQSLPLTIGDFDGDGLIEFLSMYSYRNTEGTADTHEFYIHEISSDDFTAENLQEQQISSGTPHRTRVGDHSDNRIVGGVRDDLIVALGGQDVVDGAKGDDRILGQYGDDRIKGGKGDDTLNGGVGDDNLKGGSGADVLLGERGADRLFGQRGSDNLEGGANSDILLGGAGNDILLGQGGHDNLRGGSGDDTLSGGAGNDTLVGGQGSDTFVFDTSTGDDFVRGFQAGADQLHIHRGASEFGDLTLQDAFGDLEVSFGDVTITLSNTQASQLDPGDILFT